MTPRARRIAPGSPTRAICYVRVSTEDQHLGPEAQRKAIEAWCKRQGITLLAAFQDNVSGGAGLDERPGLSDALAALEGLRAGVLVVAKRDRLARDVVLAAVVERLANKAGARVLAVDGAGNGEGAEAELFRGILDAFAQYERALIRSRTRAALSVKRGRGERTGGVPYGQRLAADGVHLEPEPLEQKALARMRALRKAGASFRSIAGQLEAEGVKPRGSRWHATTVVRALAT